MQDYFDCAFCTFLKYPRDLYNIQHGFDISVLIP